jgi:Rrf2 family protein
MIGRDDEMLSKSARTALKAMVFLARLPEGTLAGTADMAREIGSPANYLGKLLQNLARQGLVESQKGHGGGFRLALAADRISLFEVVESIDRISRRTGCPLGNLLCSERTACPLHAPWSEVQGSYLTLLKETSLDDVACGGEVPPELVPIRRQSKKREVAAGR